MISEGSCDTEDWINDAALIFLNQKIQLCFIEIKYNILSILKYKTYFKLQ